MEELGERINFYERKESFYEFSNFFLKPVDVRKKERPTTEHFFQAMKFEGNQKKRFGVQLTRICIQIGKKSSREKRGLGGSEGRLHARSTESQVHSAC